MRIGEYHITSEPRNYIVSLAKLSDHSVPSGVYVALGMLSNAEITNVLHELTRPF
ncbi:hypothetical protein A3SAC12_0031 [Lactobacillus phage 3-SAC12]|nr:hypothetical protein A3SAC12_0031 [Lactobacillus phage 3-SAC12]